MLKVVLEQNGFIVNYYHQPIIALDEFKPNFYDLIILDIEMSEINGLQLYREIRKRRWKGRNMFFWQEAKIYLIMHTNLFQYILLLQNL